LLTLRSCVTSRIMGPSYCTARTSTQQNYKHMLYAINYSLCLWPFRIVGHFCTTRCSSILRLLHSRREPARMHNRGGQRERLRKSGQTRQRMGTMGSRHGRKTWAAETARGSEVNPLVTVWAVGSTRGQQTWTAETVRGHEVDTVVTGWAVASRRGQQTWTAETDRGDE